MNTLLLMEIL